MLGAGVCLTLPQSHQRLGLVASSAPPDEVGLFRVIKAALVAQTSEPCSGLEEVTVIGGKLFLHLSLFCFWLVS